MVETKEPPLLISFSPVTSLNKGINPKNLVTFSFNSFAHTLHFGVKFQDHT